MKLLKFSSKSCSPCKVLAKTLTEIEVPYETQEIDVDVEYEAAIQFQVRGVPTLVLCDDKGAELRRSVGLVTKKQLEVFLGLDG